MQTNVSMASFPLTRLSGNNYMTWSTKIEMFLRREQLWTIVQDPPDEYDEAKSRLDEMALATLILSLEDDQLVHVRGIKTAHECWRTLRSLYVRDTMSSKIMLSRKLYRARLQPGGSMKEHLQFMRQTFQELEEKGMNFPEPQRACILLSSLDSSYDTFVLTLEAIAESELTVAFLTGRLLEEEEKRSENSKNRASSSSSSPAASRIQSTEKKSSSVHFNKKCFRCGSKNHLQRECTQERPPRKTELDSWRGKEEAKVSVVKMTQDSDQQTWLVDSGASQHVAIDPALFTELVPTPKAHVSLANGVCTPVKGQGEIFMPSLGESIKGVLCVPELQHNLLSVSCLCKQGFKVQFEGNVCNIMRGNDVCMQGKENENLYMLQEIPKVNANQECMNVFANTPEHDNCIHLMHRRLGHSGFAALKKTIECAQGLKLKKCNNYLDCATCKITKSVAYPVSMKSERNSGKCFQLVPANFMEQNWERVKDSPAYLPEGSGAQTQQQRAESGSEAQNLQDEESHNLDLPVVINSQEQENEGEQIELPITPRRSERVNKGVPPERFSPAFVCQVKCEPQSYGRVLEQSQTEQLRWRAAMDREMQSMIENKVFVRCQLPPGKKVIGCRWVYKQKTLSDGSLQHKSGQG